MSAAMDVRDGKPVAHQSVREVLFMAFATLGVIYSDIGTSPLYVMNGIFPTTLTEPPSTEDVIGSISAIVWSLTLLPLVKYSFIALRFGTNQGEGGPFALFSALFPGRDEEGDDIAAVTTVDTRTRDGTWDRNNTSDSPVSKYELHDSWVLRVINYPLIRKLLMGVAMFAVALTLSDGALTPAVSVVTAVEGLQVAQPSLTNSALIGISAAFLITLYAAQILGTRRISFIFAPIVFIWLSLLAGSGIANITHYPGIWRAYDPSRLVAWFIRTGDWTLLNGVLLAVTGSEAFFACLGQFSAPAITTAFSTFVYPCIILAYLGQGARLITDGLDVLPNVFYLTIPGGTGGALYWITFVFAIFAAIIASQAMITASQSLLHQLMSFQCIPQLRMYYTSDKHRGQVYIPSAILVMCAASVGLVGGFGTGEGLTDAYGLAVSGVFICTTIMLTISMPVRRGWPILIALAYFCIWGFFDGLFFAAALFKVPEGAYVPLGAAIILLSFFIFYAWAKSLELNYAKTHRAPLGALLAPYKAPGDTTTTLQLADEEEEGPVIAHSTGVEIRALETPILEKKSDLDAGPVVRVSSNSAEKIGSAPMAPAYIAENTAHLLLRLSDKTDPLPRVPAVALFHKKTPGTAAPASFETFLRNYPALPTVVVFLSVKYAAAPHLDASQRYDVRKLRAVSGFYRVTARFGYRDPPDMRDIADPLVDLITSIEARDNVEMTAETIAAVRAAARSAVTHIIPSFDLVAAPTSIRLPVVGPVVNWLRSFLIESIYGSISLLFPEDSAYITTDSRIRIAVNAQL